MADIDYGTPEGQVRLLIPDTATDDGTVDGSYVFSDDQITGFLAIASGNILRAAAHAMVALANDSALVLKHIRTYDLAVNGPAVADALRKSAAELRDEADKTDDKEGMDDAFQIVDLDDGMIWPEGAVAPTYGRIMGIGKCR